MKISDNFLKKALAFLAAFSLMVLGAGLTVFPTTDPRGAVGLVLKFFGSANQADSYLQSHFYKIRKDVIEDRNLSWVSEFENDIVLAMEGDSGFEEGRDPLTGASNPVHRLFLVDASTLTIKPHGFVSYPIGDMDRYRTLDMVLDPNTVGDEKTIFLSVAVSSQDGDCRAVKIFKMKVQTALHLSPSEGHSINEFFSTPCFPPSGPGEYSRELATGLHVSGGRVVPVPVSQLANSDSQEIYLSIGDFVDLANTNPDLSRSQEALLGSVLKINSQGAFEVVARGFRNPQGLAFARIDGMTSLLETEHGPRGGDELNLVVQGGDYGWPRSSYGTPYSSQNPCCRPDQQGVLVDQIRPLYSWLPSIAPSQLLQNGGLEFQDWWSNYSGEGDLIVSSLGGQSIFRIRIEEGAVRYSEQIKIGFRIRNIVQTTRGLLVLSSDEGSLVVLSAAETWDPTSDDFSKSIRE